MKSWLKQNRELLFLVGLCCAAFFYISYRNYSAEDIYSLSLEKRRVDPMCQVTTGGTPSNIASKAWMVDEGWVNFDVVIENERVRVCEQVEGVRSLHGYFWSPSAGFDSLERR